MKLPPHKEILRLLSEAFGPSGHEDDVRALISNLIEPLVDDIQTDAMGNLIATRKGKSEKVLMLDAHTDEIGVIVRHIDDKGFLRFAKIGGWDDRLFAAHRVTLRTSKGKFYYGVVGMVPPHLLKDEKAKAPIAAEDYFIDIGASNRKEAEKRGVAVGDVGVLSYPFAEIAKGVYVGKALDDRAGCALLVAVLEALATRKARTPLTVKANFATSEELGLRGARVAAFGIRPDVGLALEGTIGADFPGVSADKCICSQGSGPVITVMDNTMMVPRRMSDFLIACAKAAKVPYQIKMPSYGGTDAGAIQQARAGILAGAIAVPCRYLHSPNTTLLWKDFEDTLTLSLQAVARIHNLVA
ncbi:MAG: M42 family metallopeptidase [Calditrichaeota bacterium]|nr:M42 family metallopeptidase [Calditrichota bacterium]